MKRTLLVLTLVAVSCSSTPPPPAVPPPWTELPPVITEAVCMGARGEGVPSEAPIAIVRTTQPIVSGQSLDALAHGYGVSFGGPAQAAAFINLKLKAMPVLLPMSGSTCTFRPIESSEMPRVTDVMLLQLSSPFVNPFAKGESGLFARLSLGGRDATWYWIPVAQRKGQWLVGSILPLDLHEN